MNTLQAIISAWYLNAGYLGIVLAMAIESCCIPLPSEIVMPLAGLFVAQYPERFSLPGVALAGAGGCVLGSAVAYGIGRSGGRPLLLRYGRYVLISQADSDRADRLFARHGGAVAFFSRLVPVVRTYISLPAGIARMSFGRFLAYTLLGSLPWCAVLAVVGMKVGEHSRTLSTVFHGLDAAIGIALAAAVALYVWRHVRHDTAARAAHAGPPDGVARRPSAGPTANRPSGRPAAVPRSHLPATDRPTLPYVESVPNWPNRYARPAPPAGSAEADGGPDVSGDPASQPTRHLRGAPPATPRRGRRRR